MTTLFPFSWAFWPCFFACSPRSMLCWASSLARPCRTSFDSDQLARERWKVEGDTGLPTRGHRKERNAGWESRKEGPGKDSRSRKGEVPNGLRNVRVTDWHRKACTIPGGPSISDTSSITPLAGAPKLQRQRRIRKSRAALLPPHGWLCYRLGEGAQLGTSRSRALHPHCPGGKTACICAQLMSSTSSDEGICIRYEPTMPALQAALRP